MTLALADRLTLASTQVLARIKTPHDRMLSWDHCYAFFHRLPQSPSAAQIDEAALQLAFYLASYGMYRGSTVLLQKDYKFLIPVIQKLRSPGLSTGRPSNSVAVACEPAAAEAAWVNLGILETFLRQIGIDQTSIGILSTKIMLGTWATVPAFDTSLKAALRAAEIGKATYSKRNFLTVFAYLHKNAPAFQAQVDRFHTEGFAHYPAMRVIDALLWHQGGGDNTMINTS
jgi:hypothetical protein